MPDGHSDTHQKLVPVSGEVQGVQAVWEASEDKVLLSMSGSGSEACGGRGWGADLPVLGVTWGPWRRERQKQCMAAPTTTQQSPREGLEMRGTWLWSCRVHSKTPPGTAVR